MQKLIKDGRIVDDYWVLVKEANHPSILQALPGRNLVVPLKFWQLYRDDIGQYGGNVTIWLNSDENVNDLGERVHEFPMIALNFPVFSDGRSYTNARELRETLKYRGEIRAIGDVLRDQLFYMHRCGFNAFAIRYDQDPQACLDALADFRTGYQGSIDQPLPLFRRRSGG